MLAPGKRLVVSAGLVCVLSLGATGCWVHDETPSAKEDTSSSKDTSKKSTEKEKPKREKRDILSYTNEFFGFKAVLPEGYKRSDDAPQNNGETVVLCAKNDAGDTLYIVGRDMSVTSEIDDADKWARAYAKSFEESAKEKGETIKDLDVSEGTLAGTPCVVIESESENAQGKPVFRDYFFFVAKDQGALQGLHIGCIAGSQEALQKLEDSFVALKG